VDTWRREPGFIIHQGTRSTWNTPGLGKAPIPVTERNPYRDQRTTATSGSWLSLASASYLPQSNESGAFCVRRRFTDYHRFLRLMVPLGSIPSACGIKDHVFLTCIFIPSTCAASANTLGVPKFIAFARAVLDITSWPPHPIHSLGSEGYQACYLAKIQPLTGLIHS
jgi:hypothetical protein